MKSIPRYNGRTGPLSGLIRYQSGVSAEPP